MGFRLCYAKISVPRLPKGKFGCVPAAKAAVQTVEGDVI